jgi:hypothetical protein
MTKTPISRAGLDSSGVMVSDIEGIPSFSDGVKNMVRVHRPTSEPEDARLPALIYFHGGGWILGDARSAPQDTQNCQIYGYQRELSPRTRERVRNIFVTGGITSRSDLGSTSADSRFQSRTHMLLGSIFATIQLISTLIQTKSALEATGSYIPSNSNRNLLI